MGPPSAESAQSGGHIWHRAAHSEWCPCQASGLWPHPAHGSGTIPGEGRFLEFSQEWQGMTGKVGTSPAGMLTASPQGARAPSAGKGPSARRQSPWGLKSRAAPPDPRGLLPPGSQTGLRVQGDSARRCLELDDQATQTPAHTRSA